MRISLRPRTLVLLPDRRKCTLSVEKIPVVLRPVIKLPVKSMASIGTQENSGNLEILSTMAKF